MSDTPRDTPREVVLATLDGGLSIRKAAAKFGLPQGTVARWVNDRKHGREPKTVATLHVLPSAAPPAPKVHARERVAVAVGDALGPEIKQDVRSGVGDLTRYIARQAKLAADGRPEDAPLDWRGPDMMQLAAAARALDALLSKAGDLLAFDKTLMTETEATASAPPTAADVAGEIAKRRRQQSTG